MHDNYYCIFACMRVVVVGAHAVLGIDVIFTCRILNCVDGPWVRYRHLLIGQLAEFGTNVRERSCSEICFESVQFLSERIVVRFMNSFKVWRKPKMDTTKHIFWDFGGGFNWIFT